MKLIASLLCCMSLITTTLAQYNLEFKVNGLQKNEACILAYYYADQNKIVDTSYVNSSGKVVFKGAKNLLNGVYILVLPSRTYLEFVVPNDDQIFSIEFDTSLNPATKVCTGSLDNQAFFEFDKFAAIQGQILQTLNKQKASAKDDKEKNAYQAQIGQINLAVERKRRDLINEYPNSFSAKLFRAVLEVEFPKTLEGDTTGARFTYYRNHYWDHIDLSEDGMIRTPLFKGKLEYYMTNLFVQTPDSVIPAIDALASKIEKAGSKELYKYTVWWSTNHFEESNLICMDKVLYHMAKYYYAAGKCFWADSILVNKMAEHAKKIGPTQCGEIAPPLELVDSTFVREYDLHKVKAPVTILVFWDHQCGHCKQELPKLKAMYDTLHQKGVEVYAVYTKDDWKGWKKYIRENNLNWINVMNAFNKTSIREDYDFMKTPQVYVLDHNKKIILKNPPADNVGYIAEMMLKEYEIEMSLPKQ